MKNSIVCFLSWFIVCSFQSASADVDKALDWLVAQKDSGNGSIYLDTDIANADQSTFEAALALAESDDSNDKLVAQSAITFLETTPLNDQSTENIGRLILLKSTLGQTVNTELTELQKRRNERGGYGDHRNYAANVLATSFALRAQAKAGVNSDSQSLEYLLDQQNPDGSWSFPERGDVSLEATAYALIAVLPYRTRFNVESNISKAVAFLNSKRQNDGHWANIHQDALVLAAVLTSADQLPQYQSLIEALRSSQKSSGSWEDDVYITALVVRVLTTAENLKLPPIQTTGSVRGKIVDSSNGNFLSGVDIDIAPIGQPVLGSMVSNNGTFQFDDIAAGDYVLSFGLSGYSPVTANVNVEANIISDIGQIAMTPVIASISGTVTDVNSGLPIANATVQVSGSTSASAVTDTNGEYYLVVNPGNFVLLVSAANYHDVSASGTVNSGNTLTFSPQLTPDTAPPPITTKSDIFGVVIDKASSLPLEGVEITVVGRSITSTTDVAGAFTLSGLNHGDIQIVVDKSGYVSNQYSLVVPPSTNVDVGVLELMVEQTNPDLSVVVGEVYDLDTKLPISDVAVSLNTGESAISDIDGKFVLEELEKGFYLLSLKKGGYFDSHYSVDLPQATQFQVGRLFLKQRNIVDLSTLRGQVTDKQTGSPIENAKVKIEESGQLVVTDANGRFEIDKISFLNYSVFVQSNGYWSDLSKISQTEASTTQLNVELEPISLNDVGLEQVQTNQTKYQAHSPVEFSAKIVNDSATTQRVKVIFEIQNANNEVLQRTLFGDDVGSQSGSDIITIAPGKSFTPIGQWFTGIEPPGSYDLLVQVFDELTNRLLVEEVSTFTIEETKQLTRFVLDANPLFANVGEKSLITFSLKTTNRSNVSHALEFDYRWRDPQGNAIKSGNRSISFMPNEVDKTIDLEKFTFTFDKSGAYPIEVAILNGVTPSPLFTDTINITPSVRIESSQSIAPNRVTPNGDKRIKLGIEIKGVEQ